MFRLHCSPDLPEPVAAGMRQRLTAVARRVLSVHLAGGPVEAVLTDDTEVRRLNAAYRGRDRSTDVLSFSFLSEPAGPRAVAHDPPLAPVEAPAGELYISLQRAAAQAEEQGVTVEEELTRLLVHGLLHLAGFDHRTTAELDVMERETDRFTRLSPGPAGGGDPP